MSLTRFKAGGALTADDMAVYIERQADQEAWLHLRNMDYLLLIEPRQQGKTSLVNRLMRHPALSETVLVYVDVTTPNRSSETDWYQTLCERILRQLKFIPRDPWPPIPQNSYQWRGFLSDVATFALNGNRRVIIALDEIGAVNFPGATEFFSVLRDIFNSRQSESEFKQITFMLVGAFHPRDLIADDRVSPFNIAQRVRLPDFELGQVEALAAKLSPADAAQPENKLASQARAIAERIFYWAAGQPYLTQWLGRYLASQAPDISAAAVDRGVEQLRREDENHLPPLLDRLNADPALRDYVAKIRAGERLKFYPRENRKQAQLELLGVIKADAEGYCQIRNRLYEQALQSLFNQLSDSESKTATTAISPQLTPPSGAQYIIHVNHAEGLVIGPEARVKQNFDSGNVHKLDAFEQKLNARLMEIEKTIQVGLSDLKRGQAVIYREIGDAYREPLSQILDLIHLGWLEQGEMSRTLDAIRRALKVMQTADANLSAELHEAITGLQQQSGVESKLSLQQKLELALPIIPLFLNYKVELAVGSEVDLNAVKDEMRERWQALIGKLGEG